LTAGAASEESSDGGMIRISSSERRGVRDLVADRRQEIEQRQRAEQAGGEQALAPARPLDAPFRRGLGPIRLALVEKGGARRDRSAAHAQHRQAHEPEQQRERAEQHLGREVPVQH
jgi:hypothetical protein